MALGARYWKKAEFDKYFVVQFFTNLVGLEVNEDSLKYLESEPCTKDYWPTIS